MQNQSQKPAKKKKKAIALTSGIFHCYLWMEYCLWIFQWYISLFHWGLHTNSEWKSLSRVQLFATPWTVTHQAPLSMEFFRMDCHFLLQGVFQTKGLNPSLLDCRQIFYYLNYHKYDLFKSSLIIQVKMVCPLNFYFHYLFFIMSQCNLTLSYLSTYLLIVFLPSESRL